MTIYVADVQNEYIFSDEANNHMYYAQCSGLTTFKTKLIQATTRELLCEAVLSVRIKLATLLLFYKIKYGGDLILFYYKCKLKAYTCAYHGVHYFFLCAYRHSGFNI